MLFDELSGFFSALSSETAAASIISFGNRQVAHNKAHSDSLCKEEAAGYLVVIQSSHLKITPTAQLFISDDTYLFQQCFTHHHRSESRQRDKILCRRIEGQKTFLDQKAMTFSRAGNDVGSLFSRAGRFQPIISFIRRQNLVYQINRTGLPAACEGVRLRHHRLFEPDLSFATHKR